MSKSIVGPVGLPKKAQRTKDGNLGGRLIIEAHGLNSEWYMWTGLNKHFKDADHTSKFYGYLDLAKTKSKIEKDKEKQEEQDEKHGKANIGVCYDFYPEYDIYFVKDFLVQ